MSGAALRYPGAKQRLAPWIVAQFPHHRSYCEPYCGSVAVLLAKPRSPIEIVNDIDGRLVNTLRVLREQPEDLARMVELTPWSRREYEQAREVSACPLEDARRFLVRCWQGVGSSGSTGWSVCYGSAAADPGAARWVRVPDRLRAAAVRLRGVQIEERPALDLIRRCSKEGSAAPLLYCDPPYLGTTRSHCRRYQCEMTGVPEHQELLGALGDYPGPVFLSGYASPLYTEVLCGWQQRSARVQDNAGQRRTESLWLNPQAVAAAGGRLPGCEEWGREAER